MSKRLLKVHPKDNVIVALSDLKGGEIIEFEKATYTILKDIPAKHKFFEEKMLNSNLEVNEGEGR